MATITLASTNPVKAQAVQGGFERVFPGQAFQIDAISAPSGVPDQPKSDAETRQGALNRARAACERFPEASYWVGIEGGIDAVGEVMSAFAWVVILSGDRIGQSRTATFALPPEVVRLVREGVELGDADDIVFGRANSKQENGAVGLLTGNCVDRAELYEQAVVLALIPFRNPRLFQRGCAWSEVGGPECTEVSLVGPGSNIEAFQVRSQVSGNPRHNPAGQERRDGGSA